MVDGLQHATLSGEGSATGVATTDAEDGQVVGVTGFEGVIDLEPGEVHVVQVPPIRSGRPDDVDVERLRSLVDGADVVAAAGVEAVGALDAIDVTAATHFAPGEVAADAASRGLDAIVVATTDNVGRVTDALRDTGVSYEVT
jgi:putative transcriptional regulator